MSFESENHHLQQVLNDYCEDTDAPLPPDYEQKIGGGDYRAVGADFLEKLVTIGGLAPDDRVLDIGCGLGRMAQPILRYLSPKGHYIGVDNNRESVTWCQQALSRSQGSGQFFHHDQSHPIYNPAGKARINNQLPFAGDLFDFILMISVFTHFSEGMVQTYLKETSRLLRPGGRLFLTAFTFHPDKLKVDHIDPNLKLDFSGGGPVYLQDSSYPLTAAAINMNWFMLNAEHYGFEEKVFVEGYWHRIAEATAELPYQNIHVFQKI